MDILSNIWDWVTSHKKTTGAIVGVFLFILLMVAANNHAKQKQLEQQKAETEKVYCGMGRLLPPCQHETVLPLNRRMAKATHTHVHMESLEEAKDERCQSH